MKFTILTLLAIVILSSCGGQKQADKDKEVDKPIAADTLLVQKEPTKPKVDSAEIKASVKKIEAKYGEQWDFCDCVVKGDSINKAFQKATIPDDEFNRLSDRFDEIDRRCKAFLAQGENKTPEERAAHEKKVKKCLKAAGIKY